VLWNSSSMWLLRTEDCAPVRERPTSASQYRAGACGSRRERKGGRNAGTGAAGGFGISGAQRCDGVAPRPPLSPMLPPLSPLPLLPPLPPLPLPPLMAGLVVKFKEENAVRKAVTAARADPLGVLERKRLGTLELPGDAAQTWAPCE